MAKKLSNVAFMPAIDGISRKLALRRETCYNETKQFVGEGGAVGKEVVIPGSTYMGVITRDYNIIGTGFVKRSTLFMRKPMNAPKVTTSQTQIRAAFANGVTWAIEADQDLGAITQNQNTFLRCRDNGTGIAGVSPIGYNTMQGWMKAVAIKAIRAGKNLPESHLLDEIV